MQPHISRIYSTKAVILPRNCTTGVRVVASCVVGFRRAHEVYRAQLSGHSVPVGDLSRIEHPSDEIPSCPSGTGVISTTTFCGCSCDYSGSRAAVQPKRFCVRCVRPNEPASIIISIATPEEPASATRLAACIRKGTISQSLQAVASLFKGKRLRGTPCLLSNTETSTKS